MSDPRQSFGSLIASASLQSGAPLTFIGGTNIESLSAFALPAPGDFGWRVRVKQNVRVQAQVSLFSAPGLDPDLFPRTNAGPIAPPGFADWDVYLVDNTGAPVDASNLARSSLIFFALFATNDTAGSA